MINRAYKKQVFSHKTQSLSRIVKLKNMLNIILVIGTFQTGVTQKNWKRL
jgi:hypothetical protein